MNSSRSVILVGKNVHKFGESTFLKIIEIAKTLPKIDFYCTLIDDGSEDSTFDYFVKSSKFGASIKNIKFIKVMKNDINLGFGASIKVGLDSLSIFGTSSTLILPANDQVELESLKKIIDYSEIEPNIIGFRTNKRKARPPLKWFCSSLLNFFVQKTTFKDIKDITGLYLIETKILEEVFIELKGHAWCFEIIQRLIIQNKKIVQIPIELIYDFNTRSKRSGFRRSPRIKDVVNFIWAYLKVSFYLFFVTRKISFHLSKDIK